MRGHHRHHAEHGKGHGRQADALQEVDCRQRIVQRGEVMKPKAMSLFAGAGGMDIGVGKSGFDNICSIEMDPHCVSTLRRNSTRTSIRQVDVRAVDPQRTADVLALSRGDLALLHGGPPCQSFSQIGLKRGLHDPRGKLAFEMVRFADALRPAAVMLEQVPAFLATQAADGMTVLDVMKEAFHAIGYETHTSVLNALDFDVPQRRKRAVIVAVPIGQSFAFPEPKPTIVTPTAGDALDGLPEAVLPDKKPLMPNHVDVTPDRDRYRISFVTEGLWLSKAKDAPSDVVQRLTPKDSTKFRRLDRSKPSLTLRCGEALYHPTENRYITPREAARLQGFPDDHILEGPIRRRTGVVKDLDQHRQVANAVPPPLSRAVAGSIRSELCL